MLLPDRNKVPGRIKQGGGPDLAHGPCVCHLCNRMLNKNDEIGYFKGKTFSLLLLSMMSPVGFSYVAFFIVR